MLDFPATARNRDVIAQVLEQLWSPEKPVELLEVASGSGQHCLYFAARFPQWNFQPTDLEPLHLESIEAYRQQGNCQNVRPARQLDAEAPWPVEELYDGILAINLIHISPWSACEGLFREGSSKLKPGGYLYLYGAYQRDGGHTSPSNEAFHEGLRAQNPAWGVRHLERVEDLATSHGLVLDRVVEMPANNLSVIFRDIGPDKQLHNLLGTLPL